VRERCAATGAQPDYQDPAEGPAHPSTRIVAQLNESWRVVDDPSRWRLQRKKGNSRKKNPGWRDRSFCTTREGLLRCICEHCGKVESAALAALSALPDDHGSAHFKQSGYLDQYGTKLRSFLREILNEP